MFHPRSLLRRPSHPDAAEQRAGPSTQGDRAASALQPPGQVERRPRASPRWRIWNCHNSSLLPTGPEVLALFTGAAIERVSQEQQWEEKSLREQHVQQRRGVLGLEESAGLPTVDSAGSSPRGPRAQRAGPRAPRTPRCAPRCSLQDADRSPTRLRWPGLPDSGLLYHGAWNRVTAFLKAAESELPRHKLQAMAASPSQAERTAQGLGTNFEKLLWSLSQRVQQNPSSQLGLLFALTPRSQGCPSASCRPRVSCPAWSFPYRL